MKLIIDIPEEQYNDIVKHLTDNDGNYAYSDFNLREIIRNGTPYNPTGDCISREALKEQINATDFDCGDFYDNTEIIRESVCNAIDNAQAISLPNEQIISDIPKDYLYDTETEEFYVYRNKYTGKEIHIVKNPPAYILDKRPQGEQIAWEQGYEAGLAQAVEITEEQAINKLHETGWLIGHDKEMTERPQGECRTCRHRDTEDKKCDCGALERQGCPFPVSDDYFCKFYEKGGAE